MGSIYISCPRICLTWLLGRVLNDITCAPSSYVLSIIIGPAFPLRLHSNCLCGSVLENEIVSVHSALRKLWMHHSSRGIES